jgi:hypothetical protein
MGRDPKIGFPVFSIMLEYSLSFCFEEIIKMGIQEKRGEVTLYGTERGEAEIYVPSYMRFCFCNKIYTFLFIC